jgi:hypothetical protein
MLPPGPGQGIDQVADDPAELDPDLMRMLLAEPRLCVQLQRTLASKRWYIVMNAKVKDSPPDDLKHFWTHEKDYPKPEIIASLKHVIGKIRDQQDGPRPSSQDWGK